MIVEAEGGRLVDGKAGAGWMQAQVKTINLWKQFER
jgi:hypothetical protein